MWLLSISRSASKACAFLSAPYLEGYPHNPVSLSAGRRSCSQGQWCEENRHLSRPRCRTSLSKELRSTEIHKPNRFHTKGFCADLEQLFPSTPRVRLHR